MVAALGLMVMPSANAVHDLGVFQLDKNASTAVDSDPTALEDWDLICKANPTHCTFATGYTVPTGTTTASPHSFQVDPSESSTDDILKGGTKDDNDINSWKWASAKPSPPKNDITDAYAAEYTAPGGDKVLYFGADRFSNSGSANIAFWFFQNDIARNPATGACTAGAGCPFTGTHTVGDVSLGCSNGDGTGTCTPGDILIISAFGPKAAINIYEWVGAGNATSPCFTNNCSLQPLVTGGQACEDVTNDNACATVNDVVTPSPWSLKQKNSPDNSFQPTNFFEGGLNLTDLGVDACFSSFLVNTRASAAGDAELHDMVLGQFARCKPDMTTQASSNGTVTPGTSITDTATITVTGASTADDPTGTVTFYLCGPNASQNPDCTTGGTSVGTGTLTDSSTPANANDGVASATSPAVNTAASPLANGYYCFRAEWPGDSNYVLDQPLKHTNTTTECFRVLQLPTTTVTTPVDASGVEIHSIALGGSIYDKAVVTGAADGGDPPGTVQFFLCGPLANASDTCGAGQGTQVGTPAAGETLVSDGNATTYTSSATSDEVTPTAIGRYCFRAVYVPSGNVYTTSNDTGSTTECFNVVSMSTNPTLRPQDNATLSGIASGGTGTHQITFSLWPPANATFDASDSANPAVYTENVTVTGSGTYSTNNTSFLINSNSPTGTYRWKVVYSGNSANAGITKACGSEQFTVTNVTAASAN